MSHTYNLHFNKATDHIIAIVNQRRFKSTFLLSMLVGTHNYRDTDINLWILWWLRIEEKTAGLNGMLCSCVYV